MESSTSNRRSGKRRIFGRKKRDSSSSGNRGSGKRKRQRSSGNGSVKIRDVTKLKQRWMVGR